MAISVPAVYRSPRREPVHVSRPHVTPTVLVVGVAGACLATGLAWLPLPEAAAGLAGLGVILAVMARPAAGLVLLSLLIPFGSVVQWPWLGADLVDLVTGLSAVGFLARGVAGRRIVLRPVKLAWPLTLFIAAAAWSLTQALSWREGLPELLKWLEFAVVYVLAAQLLNTRDARRVVIALLLAGVAQACLGAYQFFRQAGPEAFLLAGRFMRAYGTFRQPNPYAGYLGYLAPVAASLLFAHAGKWRRTRQRQDLISGLLYGLTCCLVIAGIAMSWSRGGWIALGASLLVVAAFHSRRTTAVGAGITLALVGTIFATGVQRWPAGIVDRVGNLASYVAVPDPARTEITDANFAVLERLAHWQAGLAMFEQHPWLGVGIGNYATAYEKYALPHWYDPLGHAHNLFINMLAETGIVGLLGFALFWCGAFRVACRQARAASGYPRALAIGLAGTLGYLTVHSLFDNLFVQHLQLQLALLLGISAAGVGLPSTHNYEVRPMVGVTEPL